MSGSTRQIAFDLSPEPDLGPQAFQYASSNAEARIALERSDWANNALALVGPRGCGKTHLGHIWSETREAIALKGEHVFNPKSEWKGKSLWIDNAARAFFASSESVWLVPVAAAAYCADSNMPSSEARCSIPLTLSDCDCGA